MSKITINIEIITPLENITCAPGWIHFLPKFWNEMYCVLNLCDRDDGHLPAMTTRQTGNLVHAEISDRMWTTRHTLVDEQMCHILEVGRRLLGPGQLPSLYKSWYSGKQNMIMNLILLTIQWMLMDPTTLCLLCQHHFKLQRCFRHDSCSRYSALGSDYIVYDMLGDLSCRWNASCEWFVDRKTGQMSWGTDIARSVWRGL